MPAQKPQPGPQPEPQRSGLLKRLKAIFALDQPELDFGFYRIMHAKAEKVKHFIDSDLLKMISDDLGDFNAKRQAELKETSEKAIQTAKEAKVFKRGTTEHAKNAKAAQVAVNGSINDAIDADNSEEMVCDQLCRFFERYYDNG
ncbi:MAG: hypothetical protein LBF40_05715, partial [Deltaproteobacteria bacterium]|nr:hypothetical protein [Deltaproteobacteria bacterium]